MILYLLCPDINQTAFQKGTSCADAVFSTQEILLNYIQQHLYSAAINGRLIKSWYHLPTSRVRYKNSLSTPFCISRGVKQGSVLPPSLFLIVMNSLFQRMRKLNYHTQIDMLLFNGQEAVCYPEW